jgi:aryl-alcohol dehydrogenase-like predicted oxidoreductase
VIQRRPFGDKPEQLSIIGFGGIVVTGSPQAEANQAVRAAIDRGINYFDVAPSYGDAEERLGPALVGLRDDVFLACKTTKRTRTEAAAELRQSLRNLQTDRFDLYQLHAVSSVEEAETCLAPGGAIEAFVEARDAGLVRYLGFSAHSAEAAVLLLDRFPFDSILFPFNYVTFYQGHFGPQVLKAAQDKGVARLALKAMARGPWPDGADRTVAPKAWYEPQTVSNAAERALRWTLSLPITAAIPPGDARLFGWALDFAERFEPLTDAERAEMEARSRTDTPLFAAVAA